MALSSVEFVFLVVIIILRTNWRLWNVLTLNILCMLRVRFFNLIGHWIDNDPNYLLNNYDDHYIVLQFFLGNT